MYGTFLFILSVWIFTYRNFNNYFSVGGIPTDREKDENLELRRITSIFALYAIFSMPISFKITKPRQTLEQQWIYLVKRGQNNKQLVLKKFFNVLLVTTGLYLLLYFLTAANDLITLKVISIVMIALAWFTLVILYLFLGLSKRRRPRQLQEFLNSITDEQLNYSVHIDEEKVTITSSDNTYELPWTEFSRFGIHNETLYIFNEVKGINSLYWNRSERGSEVFSALLELLQRKTIKQAF